MKPISAFFRKELREAAATHKLTVLGLVFLLFGVTNPLVAKLMPEILATALPAGMSVTLPTPSAIDAWAQFYKNIPQIGLLVLLLVYGGMMGGELSRGTLTHLLTKGLSRRAVILAKFAAAALVWTGVYTVCLAATWLYALVFWPADHLPHLPLAAAGLWLFGLLLLSTLPLGGVLFRNQYGSLLFVGGIVLVLILLGIMPAAAAFNPVILASANLSLLSGQLAGGAFLGPLTVSMVLIVAFLGAGVYVFDRRAL